MTLKTFTFNPFSTNCFVCHDGEEVVIVDPSCESEREIRQLLAYVESLGHPVREILLTHAHLDHIFGCAALVRELGCGLRLHRDEMPLYNAASLQAQMFGVELEEPPEPTGFITDGEVIEIGEVRWQALLTPGHSPASLSFYDSEGGYVISGDVLFAGSIGRTDLMGASLPELMRSIYQVLLPLGDRVRVLPGHGPETTIGKERMNNPFLHEISRI
ncbi:MAG: MBL fold metallo-hydrolase [Rhodothermales bacterium]|nr:MBL fold metallo-hydrolase [Rhodothermales bacterium]MBO6780383.1 MBL fold metallo-hydrolase [Rhodothermales bacterium]